MKFNHVSFQLALLALVQLLMMHGHYLYRSNQRKNSSITNENLWMDVWIIIFCSVNIFIMIIIWFDIFRQYTSEDRCTSVAPVQSPKSFLDISRRPRFQSCQSYDIIHIRRSTSQVILNEIVAQVRRTRTFTIATKRGILIDGIMSVYIELIQLSRSLIIFIEYDHARDIDTTCASTIRQIFYFMFQPTNLIQTWGNLRLQLRYYLPFKLFTNEELVQVYSTDKRIQFQEWYRQMLVQMDDSRDNPHLSNVFKVCSSGLRKYTSNTARRWSLSEAIALCFNEYHDPDLFDINQCLAITKISNFIRKPSSHEQYFHQLH